MKKSLLITFSMLLLVGGLALSNDESGFFSESKIFGQAHAKGLPVFATTILTASQRAFGGSVAGPIEPVGKIHFELSITHYTNSGLHGPNSTTHFVSTDHHDTPSDRHWVSSTYKDEESRTHFVSSNEHLSDSTNIGSQHYDNSTNHSQLSSQHADPSSTHMQSSEGHGSNSVFTDPPPPQE